MAKGGSVRISLKFEALPFYPHALDMYRRGETTGSNSANGNLVRDFLDLSVSLSEPERQLLFDPQTSGGLLLSLSASEGNALLSALHTAGIEAASLVGEVAGGTPPGITVI